MSNSITITEDRITTINTRIEDMHNTLEGCDWCCGGGDEELASLKKELAELNVLVELTPLSERWTNSKTCHQLRHVLDVVAESQDFSICFVDKDLYLFFKGERTSPTSPRIKISTWTMKVLADFLTSQS